MNSSYLKHKFYNQIYLKILDTNKNSNNVKQIVEQNLHLRHYYVASKIFKDNLVFGSGFKTFRIESHKQKYKKDVYGSSTHPHQIHFEILAELGLVGYFLIISNLLFLLTINLKQKKDNFSISSALFILASLVPFLPSGSFFKLRSNNFFYKLFFFNSTKTFKCYKFWN